MLSSPASLRTRQETTVAEVRERAAEILAAVGMAKLRKIALFRGTRWAQISSEARLGDRDYADIQWLRAAEWLRIGWSLPTPSTTSGRSAISRSVEEMVTDQAPRVFSVVLEYGERADAQIAAWGLAFDDGAYMTTVDGRNYYALAGPENAVKYIRDRPGVTPHLVWAGGTSRE